MMASQVAESDPNLCYTVGWWSPDTNPTYNSNNGGTFEFKYNGMMHILHRFIIMYNI